ncbi:unnamed protein product [Vicia faba]|uniref:Uncharacterized protein n=1 Tax=Vicia faba TaxID=3906 RepID=A0AAV0ZEC5_VICFA|nr:unnamed protein product [Vicia faba]
MLRGFPSSSSSSKMQRLDQQLHRRPQLLTFSAANATSDHPSSCSAHHLPFRRWCDDDIQLNRDDVVHAALMMMRMMKITLKIDEFLRDRRLKVLLRLKIEVDGFTEDDRYIDDEKWRTDAEALREVQRNFLTGSGDPSW